MYKHVKVTITVHEYGKDENTLLTRFWAEYCAGPNDYVVNENGELSREVEKNGRNEILSGLLKLTGHKEDQCST